MFITIYLFVSVNVFFTNKKYELTEVTAFTVSFVWTQTSHVTSKMEHVYYKCKMFLIPNRVCSADVLQIYLLHWKNIYLGKM